MCELFAMSSKLEATINFSLEEFSRHGGHTGPHKDGWGIAFYEYNDALIMRAPEPACESQLVRFIETNAFHSSLVLSHIRKATQGDICLPNTHPFRRELGGRLHIFAHNGELPGIMNGQRYPLGHYRPIGTTDSEVAFCLLMEQMREVWRDQEEPPLERRLDVVSQFAKQLDETSSAAQANFIYSDGEYLFAHGHVRRQDDDVIRAPGLYTLCRSCHPNRDRRPSPIQGVKLSTEMQEGERQHVALTASVPLTDENWEPLVKGEVVVMQQGKIVQRVYPQ
uniref:Putative Glutamine amidotransferase, class-II n=1 Tax=Magnetococcus massalia (strain MO-1) TaxID=451514 RepID=A0A1S7LEQ2_MAGMO|nr:putative Glutamine amidotransferase, class-II [Candidatus Magnetococcus massalia]